MEAEGIRYATNDNNNKIVITQATTCTTNNDIIYRVLKENVANAQNARPQNANERIYQFDKRLVQLSQTKIYMAFTTICSLSTNQYSNSVVSHMNIEQYKKKRREMNAE